MQQRRISFRCTEQKEKQKLNRNVAKNKTQQQQQQATVERESLQMHDMAGLHFHVFMRARVRKTIASANNKLISNLYARNLQC